MGKHFHEHDDDAVPPVDPIETCPLRAQCDAMTDEERARKCACRVAGGAPRVAYKLTATDRRFLRSLRIAPGEDR